MLEWFNDGCPFVKKHYNSDNMQSLQKEFTKKGVVWLSICSSGAGQQGNHTDAEFKRILKKWNAEPTHFLVDADGKVGHLYGAKTTPDMLLSAKTVNFSMPVRLTTIQTQMRQHQNSKNFVREALDQSMANRSPRAARNLTAARFTTAAKQHIA